MSRELLKGMSYKRGKVFVSSCSSNVFPKHYYSEENEILTKSYQELGQNEFEKQFLIEYVFTGNVVLLSSQSKVIKRLKNIVNKIDNTTEFNDLWNDYLKAENNYWKVLYGKCDDEILKETCKQVKNEKKKAVDDFIRKCYDDFIIEEG